MKRTNGWIMLVLVVSMLALFTACESRINGETESDSVTKSESENEMSNALTINDISTYHICIPADANADEKYAASLIVDTVYQKTGVTLSQSTSSASPAICIGRAADDATELGGACAYAVGTVGEDIVLCGNEGLTVMAARVFLERLFSDGTSTVSLTLEEAEVIPYEPADLPSLTDFGAKPIALVDQKNANIAVYDIASETAQPTYRFKPRYNKGFSLKGYDHRIDEARLRYSAEWETYIIGFTSSSGYCAIASYPEEECLWQAELSGTSPHSIEYIPGGLVAVASSGGSDTSKGFVRLYADEVYTEVSLKSAHAVLWDETREILRALGSTDIVAYEVGVIDGTPTLSKIESYGTDQMKGGHDLSAVMGDGDHLWVGGKFVAIFDKTTGELSQSYPGVEEISTSNVKCICSFSDSSAALTVATGVYASHNTDRFNLFTFTEGTDSVTKVTAQEFVFTTHAFYKARAFLAAYF